MENKKVQRNITTKLLRTATKYAVLTLLYGIFSSAEEIRAEKASKWNISSFWCGTHSYTVSMGDKFYTP